MVRILFDNTLSTDLSISINIPKYKKHIKGGHKQHCSITFSECFTQPPSTKFIKLNINIFPYVHFTGLYDVWWIIDLFWGG